MNKLYRSRSERVFAGVAGGLARHLSIDPIYVRLFFILLALSDGIGLLLYIVLALLMPEAPESMDEAMAASDTEVAHRNNGTTIGAGLIVLGLYFLARTLDFPFLPWFTFGELWPLLLVLTGVALLRRQHQEQRVGG